VQALDRPTHRGAEDLYHSALQVRRGAEVRCWRDGVIPDLAEAVASPQRLSTDPVLTQRVLDVSEVMDDGRRH
jgi:hypothetical protein